MFAPESQSNIVRRILALRPAEEVSPFPSLAPPPMLAGAQPRPTAAATLTELDDLRKAINADIRAAARGSGELAGVKTSDLFALQRSIDAAIDASDTLPANAKKLYGDAVKTYRESYAPRFREGETARILKPAMFGENRIDPAQIVQQFTKDIDAAQQFLTTFQGDARAFESLRNGILGQFRLAAVDPATGMVDPAKAAGFMQSRAEVLSVLENGGLGLRQTLERFEQEAAQGSEALAKLNTIGGPFRDKTPAQVLDYILGSGERMAGVGDIDLGLHHARHRHSADLPGRDRLDGDHERLAASRQAAGQHRLVLELLGGVAGRTRRREHHAGDGEDAPAVDGAGGVVLRQDRRVRLGAVGRPGSRAVGTLPEDDVGGVLGAVPRTGTDLPADRSLLNASWPALFAHATPILSWEKSPSW
jgi:hypothetical protein